MRVAIDGVFLGAGRGGDETFLRGVLRGLALRRAPDDEFPLILPHGYSPPEAENDPAFPVVRLPVRPGPWHFGSALPKVLRQLRPDLALTVTHAALTGRVGSAVTIGDLSFVHRPQEYPRGTAARLRALVPVHARRARVVLVPSEYTRADVIDCYGIEPERVRVVPNRVVTADALSEPAAREADEWIDAHGVGARYLLYLGNLHPRKNVPRLIRCFLTARSTSLVLRDCQLVIAGGHWWRGNAEQVAAGGSPQVRFLGRVSDAVRDRLLARAAAVAYLSLFEGFGLPPLEAMAYGIPVIAADRTSLPEVCGPAALLVDPESSDQIVDGLVQVLTDPPLRARLSAAGRTRAAAFDAERVGDAVVDAFRFALQPSSTPTGSVHSRERKVA